MATNANQYVVNLVDLQNIATSITGNASNQAITQLQTDVGNLQEMVNYNTKTVSTDTLTEFTQGHGINVTSDLTATSINTNTNTNTNTVNQGIMAFKYSSGSFTGLVSGSLPSSFASSVLATAQTITVTLQSTYSTSNFPSYTGIVYWYTNGGYLSLSIPNTNVIFTGTQITINLSNQLQSVTPDASGFSVWLTLTSFN